MIGMDAGNINAVEAVTLSCLYYAVRVATDDTERALLWKGRKSAFGAIAQIAPHYHLHDCVVPRTKLVEVHRVVYGGLTAIHENRHAPGVRGVGSLADYVRGYYWPAHG